MLTVNTVYNALPKINNKINYRAENIEFYAPITGGTAGQYLKATGATSAPSWASVVDATTARDMSTSSNLITERAVYYGLPTINGTKAFKTNPAFYAPTTKGANTQVLIGNASGAPTWTDISGLSVATATKATQDAGGNVITSTYATKAQAISNLTFDSTTGQVTITYGDNHTTTKSVYAQPVNPVHIGNTAPANRNFIWIDSGNGYILKVCSNPEQPSQTAVWIAPRSVWGG